MKKIFKLLGWMLLLVFVLGGIVFLIAWKSPKYYEVKNHTDHPLLSFKNYTATHTKPYIIEQGNLVIFGAEHTKDPADPQIKIIEQKWDRLQPTVALVEGRLGFLLPMFMNPVKELGEGGKVKELAS